MSKLIELYVNEIIEKRIVIDDVPAKLRDNVENELNKLEKSGE